ncbi:MAG: amidase family protein, partial [Saprospiraceae bacterium]
MEIAKAFSVLYSLLSILKKAKVVFFIGILKQIIGVFYYLTAMNRRTFVKNTLAASAALSIPYACRMNQNSVVTQIIDWSALELSNAIRLKHVSCVEDITTYLKHIQQYNPVYNAIISRVSDDTLMGAAQKADAALAKGVYWGWMHGMPHAIKDLAPVEGMRFTQGSLLFKN